MNADEFVALVGKMRAAQKDYFRSRLSKDVIRAKDFERQVDKALAEGITLGKVLTEVNQALSEIGMKVEPMQETLFKEGEQ